MTVNIDVVKIGSIICGIALLILGIFAGKIFTEDRIYQGNDITIEVSKGHGNIVIINPEDIEVEIKASSNTYFQLENNNQVLSSALKNSIFTKKEEMEFILEKQGVSARKWKVVNNKSLVLLNIKSDQEIEVIYKFELPSKLLIWFAVCLATIILWFFCIWITSSCYERICQKRQKKLTTR